MAIDFEHKEYKSKIETWEKVDNVCAGEDVGDYLVPLNPSDKTPANRERNAQYKKRAVFYPIAGRTARGLVELMFSKPPTIELPTALEYLKSNVDGMGTSLDQQARDLSGDVVKKARGGLFTTYPRVDRELSKADMASGSYFSTIHEIEAEQVINWRYVQFGSIVKLALVVIKEEVEEVGPDGYSTETIDQIRELSLIGGVVHVSTWRENEKKEWIIYEGPYAPTDGSGKVWDNIPFQFVGSESNTAGVDDSMMTGLADLNIAHYRNSADYEDSVWYVGQAQGWMSGVDQAHIDMMQANDMYIGSRELLAVPTGERFGFESASPNTMVRQAMLDKVDAMIGVGANYIQPNGVAKTAEEASGDNEREHSTLSMISLNIGDAYTQAIKWAAKYMNVTEDGIEYQPLHEFAQPEATAQEIQAMVAGFLQGAIPMSDYFRWLKRVDIADSEKTIEQFAEEVNQSAVDMPNLNA